MSDPLPPPGDSEPPTEPVAKPPAQPEDEPPTEPVRTRWSGSAAVPAPAPGKAGRGRRRRDDDPETLELSAAEDAAWPPPPPPPQHNPARPVTAVLPPGWGPDDVAQPPTRKPPKTPKPPRMRPPMGPVGYPGYPPAPPPRRRRRWPWVLLFLTTLMTVCCCGCAAWAKPFVDQRATVAVPPQEVAGLVRVQDPAARLTTITLETDVRTHHWLAEDVFAVVYAEPDGRQRVTLFGATQFRWSPEQDLIREMDRLSQKLSLIDVAEADPGKLGGHMRCGKGQVDGRSASVCGWADHGSMAVATFPGRGIADSAELLRALRSALLKRE